MKWSRFVSTEIKLTEIPIMIKKAKKKNSKNLPGGFRKVRIEHNLYC